MSEETVTFNLELNAESAIESGRQVETVLYRALGLWGRICDILGVPKDSPVSFVVDKIQQVVMIIRILHTASIMLESSTGLGLLKGGLGLASGLLSMGALIYSTTRGR